MTTSQSVSPPALASGVAKSSLRKIITASSVGTLIEWYDFYIYGSLAVVFSGMFFPEGNGTAALLVTIAAFGTGFVVRPIGAMVFGRMGDRVGRKKTFMTTLLIMGGATTMLGLMPTYDHIGILAPILLVTLRLLQGLAIGGEYGGAVVYIAENSPARKRGASPVFSRPPRPVASSCRSASSCSAGSAWASRHSVCGAGGFRSSCPRSWCCSR